MANRFNESLPSFAPLYSEFLPGLRIIDNFSDHIAFNICNKGKDNKHHAWQLDDLTLESSSSPSTAIIASELAASIKNNIATSILHIHTFNNPIIKIVYHVVHVISTKAKLFAIRWGINQALKFNNMSKVIVITGSIHMVKKIFEPTVQKMMFQASNLKENQFLDLLDDDNNTIEPSYVKGGSWLKMFGHSNSLCVHATRAITNHTLIGEYRLRFFSMLWQPLDTKSNNYTSE